jgi:hypothetical protein
VASGHLATVLVEGEAGIGKIRLLAEALDDARGRGLEVVTGRAQELERTRPSGSWPTPWRAPARPRSSDPGLQFQAVDAFGDLIEALALDRLGEDAVTELVTEVVDARPGPRLLAEVAGAAGNPLFVTELVGALLQEGAIQVADGRPEVAETSLPPTLRLTILRRLSLLPDETLQVLRAASILGSSFSLTQLSTTMARSALELASVLAEAIRARVLQDDGDRLRFRHDLLREAIYEDLPASVGQALHHEAGRRLAASGAEALAVAEQLARGATPGDAEAEAICRSLLDRDLHPSVEGQARTCLGWIAVAEGRMREALRQLAWVHRSPTLGDQSHATAWGWASMAHLSLGELAAAAAAAAKARSAAAFVGDHATTSLALTCLAVVDEFRGNLREAVGIIDGAVRLADQSPQRKGTATRST